MPGLAAHFGLSLIVNMAIFGRKEKKQWLWIILLSPLSIYHDIDILFKHRVILHSFFIQALVVVAVYLLTKRNLFFTGVVAINVFSHILMDMSQFYVACFWPLTNGVFSFHFDVFVNMSDPSIIDSNISGDFANNFPSTGLEQWGTLLSTLGLLISFCAVLVWIIHYYRLSKDHKKKKVTKHGSELI
ncbi:MAG: metal-dependent hydrolase [Candidatus Heimdallarchaeaceae archaeon]